MGATQVRRVALLPSRSIGLSPAAISPSLWVSADSLGAADGTALSSIPDLSGNGRSLGQADPAKRPTYRSAGFNGRGAIRFDGVDDHVENGFSPGGFTVTIFVVAQFNDAGSGGTIIDNTAAWHHGLLRRTDSTHVSSYFATRDHAIETTTQSPHIYTSRTYPGPSFSPWQVGDFRVDSGDPVTDTNQTVALPFVGVALGWQWEGGAWGNADIAEVVVKVSTTAAGEPNVSDIEATGIRDYLKARWGTP